MDTRKEKLVTADRQQRVENLVAKLPTLTTGQLYWLNRVIKVFESSHAFEILQKSILDAETLENFGDALRIHHSFSLEPFSKDKFEYVLESVLKMSGHQAALAPRGNRGHDITIDGIPVSLKTQADSNISHHKIWISKFMELGRGTWGDNPNDLVGLRDAFLHHLKNYERIFTLRALQRAPQWHYELVEIPKNLMQKARGGRLEMKLNSIQFPKPGYCYVNAKNGDEIYQLYFDGGTERKLQLKNLKKTYCRVHARWQFTIPPD